MVPGLLRNSKLLKQPSLQIKRACLRGFASPFARTALREINLTHNNPQNALKGVLSCIPLVTPVRPSHSTSAACFYRPGLQAWLSDGRVPFIGLGTNRIGKGRQDNRLRVLVGNSPTGRTP